MNFNPTIDKLRKYAEGIARLYPDQKFPIYRVFINSKNLIHNGSDVFDLKTQLKYEKDVFEECLRKIKQITGK